MGTWPINNKEEDEIHFLITDEELNKLEEYTKYEEEIKSIKIKNLSSDSSMNHKIDNRWSSK
tara:strand:+ start:230 stop:415 length:186 start_codon:yes stop_codon:yes gene_type:complete